MSNHPLLDIKQIEEDIERYLERIGKIFTAFRLQDSSCISYGVQVDSEKFFVKHSNLPRGLESLNRAIEANKRLQHPALPALYNRFTTPGGGLALVYEWSNGVVLYDYTRHRGERLTHPESGFFRFNQLPLERKAAALETIYDLHELAAEKGLIAVDFYDGCILYDFKAHKVQICDLDEYHTGPFVLEADRLPGGQRFMAPEEFQRGATIDQVTNVFMLGRCAFELLTRGSTSRDDWPLSPAKHAVVLKAISPQRENRYQSVKEFISAFRTA